MFFLILALAAQLTGRMGIGNGPTLPTTCSPGDVFVVTGIPAISVCSAINTWSQIATTTSSSIPAGLITLINSGTCPTGWTEVSGLNGKFLRGTIAANSNVGQSSGSDAIVPTINTLTAAAQTIAWPVAVPINGAIATGTFANVATATTGNYAATNVLIGTGAANACKATAPNLVVPAESHSGSLVSPTITWPASVPTNSSSSVTGTLNGFDNRPAYTNVIFCSKN